MAATSRVRIDRVLAGHADYDALDRQEQAIVRAAWGERIADRLDGLDFAGERAAAGEPYAELDEHGQAVRRQPSARA